MMLIAATIPTEVWISSISACIGAIGGISGSIATYWIRRRRRKVRQRRNLEKSEHMGIARFDIKTIKNMPCDLVPKSLKTSGSEIIAECYNFVKTVKDMIRDRKSGIVVVWGPSDTGKETLLCKAVADCMPNVFDSTSSKDRSCPKRRQVEQHDDCHDSGDVSFFYVEDMARNWEEIRNGVIDWFRIRAEKQAAGRKVCIVYFDFNFLSGQQVVDAVDKVKELHAKSMDVSCDEMTKVQKFNIVFAAKITTGDKVDVPPPHKGAVTCFKLSQFCPDQMPGVLSAIGVEEDERKDMDMRWVYEYTDGKIGRLKRFLRHDDDEVGNKGNTSQELICKGWFRNDGLDRLHEVNIGKGMAVVYLLAAIARHMDSESVFDVRSFVACIGGSKDASSSFDAYRTILQNAFLFAYTDYSAVKRDDFHMDDLSFWDSFLSSWGVFGKYDFIDELHDIIRSLQVNEAFKSILLPVSLSVSDALIKSSGKASAKETVNFAADRFNKLMDQIRKIPGFRRIFHIAFARSLDAWLWSHIGTLENDDIDEAVAKVVMISGGDCLDPAVLVEFLPVLVVVSRNPIKWFGGNKWWNKVDQVSRINDNGSGPLFDDDVETLLLLFLYVSIALSTSRRVTESEDELGKLADYIKSIRSNVLPLANKKVLKIIRLSWRVLKESARLESACYFDNWEGMAESRYMYSIVKLLKERSLWWNTRFSYFVPTFVRALRLDVLPRSSQSMQIFRRLTSGIDINANNLSVIYGRCHVLTLIGLLNAHRNFYGISTDSNVKGLLEQLRGKRKYVGAHSSNAELDEPEKLRCIIWIQSEELLDMLWSRDFDEGEQYKVVHDFLNDVLAWQKDLTYEYRGHCFKYLSRLCHFMSRTDIDANLADAYLFLEALSEWLGRIDERTGTSIIKELNHKSFSTRCGCVMEVIPEIFANVYNEFADLDEWGDDWENRFNGRRDAAFLSRESIKSILLESRAFVENASVRSRSNLMLELLNIDCSLFHRNFARRIAELSLGKTLEGLSYDMSDMDYYAHIFSALENLEDVTINRNDLWKGVAHLVGDGSHAIILRSAYEYVRRMEHLGRMVNSSENEALYYSLGNKDALREIDGYEDWCALILKRIPSDGFLRKEYIKLAFELRSRPDVGESVARNAILGVLREGNLASDEKESFDDYDWRLDALSQTQDICDVCLSEDEQDEVRRFVFEAWSRGYRPIGEGIYNFIQGIIKLDIKPWVEVVQAASETVLPPLTFFPHVLLEGDMVDVAVSTDEHALLMNVLPDRDYEVGGSIQDECHGSISLVSEGVISIGFVTMLQRIRETLQRLEPDSYVDIGVVANGKTLQNIRRMLNDFGLEDLDLYLLDYNALHEQITEIFSQWEDEGAVTDEEVVTDEEDIVIEDDGVIGLDGRDEAII